VTTNTGTDLDHTQELIGFLPWAIVENYGKLKSSFSYLKAYEEAGGTSEEIANAQANVVYTMGVMGHFVGDASQPLHTTVHYNGCVGENPHGYTTNLTFHQWIDGEYFRGTGGLKFEKISAKIHPAHRLSSNGVPNGLFHSVMNYILEQNGQVEFLYQLKKEGKLSAGDKSSFEGRAFLEGQLNKAGQMLGELWVTAWQEAPADVFLKTQLRTRSSGITGAK
jgi:hypothetical protein